jgi:hypothetical protein
MRTKSRLKPYLNRPLPAMPPQPSRPVNTKHGRAHDIKSGSGAKATIRSPVRQTIEFIGISI